MKNVTKQKISKPKNLSDLMEEAYKHTLRVYDNQQKYLSVQEYFATLENIADRYFLELKAKDKTSIFEENSSTMKFTVKQLALLGTLYFKDPANFAGYEFIATAVKMFIELGDPYDLDLLSEFVQAASPEPFRGTLADKETFNYFLRKCAYWFDPAKGG